MKKILIFSWYIVTGLTLLAFILMVATPAIDHINYDDSHSYIDGIVALFGTKKTYDLFITTSTSVISPSPLGLIGWTLIILAISILIVQRFFYKPIRKIIGRFDFILNYSVCLFLLLAGIFAFCVVASFYAANGYNDIPNNTYIGAGWVVSGILLILASLFRLYQLVRNQLSK